MTTFFDSDTESTVDQPSAVTPGEVEPGWCWVLQGRVASPKHFPTWELANAQVTIDLEEPEYSRDVIRHVECEHDDDCLRLRRLAAIAYREHQERLAADQAAAEQEQRRAEDERWMRLIQVERSRNESERDHQQKLREIEAGYRERQTEALVAEADYRQQRLEFLAGEAESRERQLQDQANQAAEQAATDRAWRLVDAAQSEIGKADAKAGWVITLELALIGAVGAGALGVSGLLRWVAIAAVFAGVLAAAWAVFPRRARRTADGRRTSLNYGAVCGQHADDLADQLRDIDELQAASAEAVVLARITHVKYVAIQWSMLAGAVGLVAAVIGAAS
jgi:hypothetical protein